MDLGFADDSEAIPAIQCSDRIPLDVFQSDWHSLLIREQQAMPEHYRTKPFAPVVGEQIEFAEASMIGEPMTDKFPPHIGRAQS